MNSSLHDLVPVYHATLQSESSGKQGATDSVPTAITVNYS